MRLLPILIAGFLAAQSSSASSQSSTASAAEIFASTDSSRQLLKVTRVYVDSFGETDAAQQIYAMVLSALVRSHLFQITENRNSADAVLKGSATELTSKELRGSSEETAQAIALYDARATAVGNVAAATASGRGTAHSEKDATLVTETRYDARLAVRLVDPSGDVIWATIQDTRGSKYTTAVADLADKTVAQLVRDIKRLDPSAARVITSPTTNDKATIIRNARTLWVVVEGDKAMEAELNKKLLSWGKLTTVSGAGKADLVLEITQTGKFNMMRYGSAVTAAAVLRNSESGEVMWSTTKGGFWSMSGASTRQVGGQIAKDLTKYLDSLLKSR